MKKMMLVAALSALVVFSGCTPTKNSSTKESSASSSQVANASSTIKTKMVNNIEMKIVKLKSVESGEKNKNMFSIEMDFLNKDRVNAGVGSFDFRLKTADKTYDVDIDSNNLGDEFKPDAHLKGTLYFKIPSSVKKATLIYEPAKKKLAEWDLTIPATE